MITSSEAGSDMAVVARPKDVSALARRTLLLVECYVLAVAVVVLLHLVLLAFAAATSAVVASRGGLAWAPRQPLLLALVAVLLAHCSSGAIWWARSTWPAHVKTLLALVCCAGLWLVLTGCLKTVALAPLAAAAWATSIALQVIFTAAASAAMESALAGRREATASRFTIMYLFIWTTLVAVVLGIGRHWAVQRGWTFAAMLDWPFWRQVQVAGLINSLLAFGVLASLRLPRTWHGRAAACLGTIYFVGLSGPIMMWLAFGTVKGAELVELVWIWGVQGMFLAITLVPLTIAAERMDARA